MVHELIGIDNNKISLDAEDVHKDLKTMVLSADQDQFFAENLYLTYPEVRYTLYGLNIWAQSGEGIVECR